jgi:predicted sulfurtransferase
MPTLAMKPRLPPGSSDPISFSCTCTASSDTSGGTILLFYRYFAAPPSLLRNTLSRDIDIQELAAFHSKITQKFHLGGNIRVGREGFNITVGGTKDEIESYMKECMSHWSFLGLGLDTEEKRYQFFKPTGGGCSCSFGGSPASVRITMEITPMGVTNYIPEAWDAIESLEPAEFHERCWADENNVLIDVRNHYESRIGYFVNPKTGEGAVRPGIRRFSQ